MSRMGMNLDSLTDIVSNSIGILVMLAVLTVLQQGGKTYEISVPIEHETNTAPVFFICRDDSVFAVPATLLFDLLVVGATELKAERGTGIVLGDLSARLTEGEEDDYRGIILRPRGTNSWDSREDIIAGRDCPTITAIDEIDSERNYAYFFVFDADNGMDVFDAARKRLLKRAVKCGWRPVDDENPIVISAFSDRWEADFRPSFTADVGESGGDNNE